MESSYKNDKKYDKRTQILTLETNNEAAWLPAEQTTSMPKLQIRANTAC